MRKAPPPPGQHHACNSRRRTQPVPVAVTVVQSPGKTHVAENVGGGGGSLAFQSYLTVPGSGYSDTGAAPLAPQSNFAKCGTFEGGYDVDGGRVPMLSPGAIPPVVTASCGYNCASLERTGMDRSTSACISSSSAKKNVGARPAAAAAAAAYAAVATGASPPAAAWSPPVAAPAPAPVHVPGGSMMPVQRAPGSFRAAVPVQDPREGATHTAYAPPPVAPAPGQFQEWPSVTGPQPVQQSSPHVNHVLEPLGRRGVGSTLLAPGAQGGRGTEQADVFEVGAIVEYDSPSLGQWIPAKILARLPDGRYDLDCKPGVHPSRLRAIPQMVALSIAGGSSFTAAPLGMGVAATPVAAATAPVATAVVAAAVAPVATAAAPRELSSTWAPLAPCPKPDQMPSFGLASTAPGSAAGVPRSMRVLVGKLEFRGTGSIGGVPGIFDSVGFRVRLQYGGLRTTDMAVLPGPDMLRFRPKWVDGGPVTEPLRPKYGRTVSSDGRYNSRVFCDYDEGIDLPWPPVVPDMHLSGPGQLPGHISADVWLERRTTLERVDSILTKIGLGGGVPEYDHVWLGRAVASLPAEGTDTTPFPWPVEVEENPATEGPVPRSIVLGIEWVTAADADDDELGDRPLFGGKALM